MQPGQQSACEGAQNSVTPITDENFPTIEDGVRELQCGMHYMQAFASW